MMHCRPMQASDYSAEAGRREPIPGIKHLLLTTVSAYHIDSFDALVLAQCHDLQPHWAFWEVDPAFSDKT